MTNSISKILFIVFLLTPMIMNTAQNEEELRDIIEPLNEKYINSILEDDLESYLSLFTDDATVMLPFSPTIKGKHALTVNWHNNMSRGDFVESTNVTILEVWASGDLMYERGSYQITFKKSENNPKAVYGSYFTIWKKQNDGSYKIKYDISNLNHGV